MKADLIALTSASEAAAAKHLAALEKARQEAEEDARLASEAAEMELAAVHSIRMESEGDLKAAASNAQAELEEAVESVREQERASASKREARMQSEMDMRLESMAKDAEAAAEVLKGKLDRLSAEKAEAVQARLTVEQRLKEAEDNHRRGATADRNASAVVTARLERQLADATNEVESLKVELSDVLEKNHAFEAAHKELIAKERESKDEASAARAEAARRRR